MKKKFIIISILLTSLLFQGCIDDKTKNQLDNNSSYQVDNNSSYQASAQAHDYSKAAQGLDYRKAMLEQINNGELVIFKGKIIQATNSSILIATKFDEYLNYFGDNVFLHFEIKPQVLEDDIVTIYGRYDGILTYESVLGQQITVPKIIVDYYRINGQAYNAITGELVAPATETNTTTADGKTLFTACAACHGADGKTAALGKSAIIAGKASADIETKLKAYKAGTRDVTGYGASMKYQAGNLSDDQIKALADYISKL